MYMLQSMNINIKIFVKLHFCCDNKCSLFYTYTNFYQHICILVIYLHTFSSVY